MSEYTADRLEQLSAILAAEADEAEAITDAEERGYQAGRASVVRQLVKIREGLGSQVLAADTIGPWVDWRHKRDFLDEIIARFTRGE
jgi:hypothetical protein